MNSLQLDVCIEGFECWVLLKVCGLKYVDDCGLGFFGSVNIEKIFIISHQT